VQIACAASDFAHVQIADLGELYDRVLVHDLHGSLPHHPGEMETYGRMFLMALSLDDLAKY
jgi:hypothetical protein